MTGTAPATLDAMQHIGNLTINNSAPAQLARDLSMAGNMTISSGILDVDDTNDYDITIAGTGLTQRMPGCPARCRSQRI